MLLSPAGGECCKSRRRGMNRGRSKMTEEQADVLVSRRGAGAQRLPTYAWPEISLDIYSILEAKWWSRASHAAWTVSPNKSLITAWDLCAPAPLRETNTCAYFSVMLTVEAQRSLETHGDCCAAFWNSQIMMRGSIHRWTRLSECHSGLSNFPFI